MTEDTIVEVTYRGSLSRSQVAETCGFNKQSFKDNQPLKDALLSFEEALRAKEWLPALTESAKAAEGAPRAHDGKATQRRMEAQRLGQLEKENHDLRVQVQALKDQLEPLLKGQETLEAFDQLGIFEHVSKD